MPKVNWTYWSATRGPKGQKCHALHGCSFVCFQDACRLKSFTKSALKPSFFSGQVAALDLEGTGSRWGQPYTCQPNDKFLGLLEWWESCGECWMILNDAFRCRSGSIAQLQLLLKVTLLFRGFACAILVSSAFDGHSSGCLRGLLPASDRQQPGPYSALFAPGWTRGSSGASPTCFRSIAYSKMIRLTIP